MGMVGNEASNLGMLPRGKALTDGPMLTPNPWWGCHWDSRAVTEGLAEVFWWGRVSFSSAWLVLAPCHRQEGITCPCDHPHSLFSALVVLRTFYLQGLSRADSAAWYGDIQASAGGRGNALRDQQLSRGDIPIIVDSCIAFITQYGEPDTPRHPPTPRDGRWIQAGGTAPGPPAP